MKKILLIAGLILAVTTINAQYYIGGSFGISGNSGKNADGKKIGYSNMNFSITPEIGYNLSEKSDIGISVGFLNNTRKSYQFTPDEMSSKITTSGWSLSPYIRYSFINFGRFDVLGKFALNFSENIIKYFDGEGNQNDKYSSTIIGVNLVPLLFYNLSDRIALYTQLNFLNLDFSSITDKRDGSKSGSNSSFNFGTNTDNLATIDQLRIGFVYKF